MKKMRKIFALLIAMVMVFGMGTRVFAENGTITITPPSGTPADTTNSYKIYKVFDAEGDGTNISYKLVNGKTAAPAGFEVDDAGNVLYTANKGKKSGDEGFVTELTQADIDAIMAYVTEDDLVDTATSTGTANAVSKSLPNGFYLIKTSTGSLVTINSTNPNVSVNDKNTIPEVDKKITGASSISDEGKKALAQIGTDVEYTATVTVGKGSKNLVFHDKMATGLTFKGNDNVSVTAEPEVTGIEGNWYTIKDTPDSGDTLTITFADGIAENTKITIKYVATINANALTKLENDAKLTYGDGNTTTSSKTEVYNAEIAVNKFDGPKADNKPLANAGFKLRNSENKYYHLEGTVVSWVEEAQGDEHKSGADGKVPAFTGLANGEYTLVETTVPAGYNKAADTPVTIASGNYESANLSKVADVENNKGSVLPSTGGIGTTIFYTVGAMLVLGAGIVLVSKRRMNA